MTPDYRQETESIEAAGKLWAEPLLNRLLHGTLAGVEGRAFQFKDGDYQVVDRETGCVRSLELKCRGDGKWYSAAPVLLELWHDKNVYPGWAMTCKAQLLAYAWEDIHGVLVLDAQPLFAWYKNELYRIRRGERPCFFRREPHMNLRQPNQTVFDCISITDVKPFIVAIDLGRASLQHTNTENPPKQPSFF